LVRFSRSVSQRLKGLGWWNLIGVGAAWAGYVLVVLWRYQRHFADFAPQVWMFWLATGAGALFLAAWKRVPYAESLLLLTIIYAAGVRALGFLPDITSYPFSIAWSEGSRYFYASLPFSRLLYGYQIPLSSLHPTRYLLQSVAFWLPGAGIAFHRFWQVFLWLSLSLLAGLALARHFRIRGWANRVVVALWAVLFNLQGPVYYHLLVCVVLVLFGFDRKRFWKTLVFVVLASAWAGISRVNWMPVPAFLALALYLLEKPLCEDAVSGQPALRTWGRYLWPPFAWGVSGGLAALASQAAYVLISGHENVGDFGTSFTSALLWYRLIPSPTYPLGVIPAVLLVSAPLLVLIIENWRRNRSDWHALRITGLGGMAAVLLVGGLVVSAKIGGGSNIHNMDAYLVLLLVIGAGVGLGGYVSERSVRARPWRPWLLVAAVVILPAIWNLDIGNPFVQRDFQQARYDLTQLKKFVNEYAPRGEVLFITQRQLEVYNEFPGIPMVPEYELMTLMEMAISGNQLYFDHFEKDLQNHRFALIVADRQHKDIKGAEDYSFAEENNAWVEYVSKPLLTYYQEELYFDTQGIQLLVPKK
jgi:hypothetical protein